MNNFTKFTLKISINPIVNVSKLKCLILIKYSEDCKIFTKLPKKFDKTSTVNVSKFNVSRPDETARKIKTLTKNSLFKT